MKFGCKELLFIGGIGLSQSACVGDKTQENFIIPFDISKNCDLSISDSRQNMNVQERVLDILQTCDERVLKISEAGYCGIPAENILSNNMQGVDIDESCFDLTPLVSEGIYSGQPVDDPKNFENIFLELSKMDVSAPELSRQIKSSNWIKIIVDEYKLSVNRPLYTYLDILKTLSQLSENQQKNLIKNPKWNQFLHRFDSLLVEGDIEGNLVGYLVDVETAVSHAMSMELLAILSSSKYDQLEGYLASESVNM